MGWFGKQINKLGGASTSVKELGNVTTDLKNTAYNIKANRITLRYFTDLNFKSSQDIIGEIVHNFGTPIIIFEKPFSGCVLYLEECTYHNQSKENELTMDIVKDYPFGVDHKSDLFKDKGLNWTNSEMNLSILDKSQKQYYGKTYKFYIPMMLNKTPIPIIRLDDADRILKPVNKIEIKRLANITQVFLRTFIRLKLLEKTGTKKESNGYLALFCIIIGMVLQTFIMALID